MLLGLTGPICSGKSAVAEYLSERHGFEVLRLQGGEENLSQVAHYVSENWTGNFVIYPICSLKAFEAFQKRPYFLLVAVDAPMTFRFQRYKLKRNPNFGLEDFVALDDSTMYHLPSSFSSPQPRGDEQGEQQIRECMNFADVLLINDGTIQALREDVDHAELTNSERLRPSWETYFMRLADLAARRSNCMKRRVGCVLVVDNRVVATGYNGTPRNTKNCNQGGCKRCNSNTSRGQGLDYCLCLHAEENALLEAGRMRSEGAVIYCNTCPCLPCAKKIVQAGVKRVVYSQEYGMDDLSKALFAEAGVLFEQYRLLPSLTQHVRAPKKSPLPAPDS